MAVDTGAEGCDAFPLQSFLDFDIRDGPDGAVVAFLEVDDRHLNPNGIVHGGVVFTLADTAMGRATMAVLGDGQICASIEVSVRYLRPIPGGRLVATASVLRAGRRIVHL
jgi:acyl-CoA thioesterase